MQALGLIEGFGSSTMRRPPLFYARPRIRENEFPVPCLSASAKTSCFMRTALSEASADNCLMPALGNSVAAINKSV